MKTITVPGKTIKMGIRLTPTKPVVEVKEVKEVDKPVDCTPVVEVEASGFESASNTCSFNAACEIYGFEVYI